MSPIKTTIKRVGVFLSAGLLAGCAGVSAGHRMTTAARAIGVKAARTISVADTGELPPLETIQPVSHETAQSTPDAAADIRDNVPTLEGDSTSGLSLSALVDLALESNPKLQRLEQESYAAWDRVRYVDALPDPVIGANGFGNPIETAAGSQQANLSFSQRFPWLKRLDAQEQQAAFEAMSLEQLFNAEKLKLTAEVKVVYYRLYVLGQQIQINRVNNKIVEALLKIAIERVRAPADRTQQVYVSRLASLELGRLQEEWLALQQRDVSTKARLNQLLNRPSETPVTVLKQLDVDYQPLGLDLLRQFAVEHQPEIAAARLRTEATTWGVRVAELRRMPDFAVNFAWFFIDDDRPASTIVDVGEDAWSVGAVVNIPLWRDKYDAIEAEATRKHLAAHAATDDVIRRYDALLADLLEQAGAAGKTATLYDKTMLPLARQIYEADRLAYQQAKVGEEKIEFDRVLRDYRDLLNLEVEYHRAMGRLAAVLARIEQAIGTNLNSLPPAPNP